MTMKSEYERIGHEGTHLQQRLEDELEQEKRMASPYDPGQVRFKAHLARKEALAKQITDRLEAALERQR